MYKQSQANNNRGPMNHALLLRIGNNRGQSAFSSIRHLRTLTALGKRLRYTCAHLMRGYPLSILRCHQPLLPQKHLTTTTTTIHINEQTILISRSLPLGEDRSLPRSSLHPHLDPLRLCYGLVSRQERHKHLSSPSLPSVSTYGPSAVVVETDSVSSLLFTDLV